MSIKGFSINGQVQRYDYNALDNIPPSSGGGGITNEVKEALLQLAQKVAYVDANGQTYYQALYDALNAAAKVLTSITAVFNQGSTVIYTTDTLNDLKPMLTVTANYDDSTTATVTSTDYTLSGTLTVGTSTITASYGGKTDTFTVTVTEYVRTLLHAWDFTQSTTDTVGSATADMGSNVTRDSSGLHFTAAKLYQYFKMFGVIESNITIEVDVASANNHDSGANRRFICFAADTGLVYRSNGKWQWYLGAWCNPSVSVTNANVFNGKTAIIKIDSNSIPTAYDSDGNTIADNATSASSYSDLWLGSTDYTFYDMTITAVRIYRGID